LQLVASLIPSVIHILNDLHETIAQQDVHDLEPEAFWLLIGFAIMKRLLFEKFQVL